MFADDSHSTSGSRLAPIAAGAGTLGLVGGAYGTVVSPAVGTWFFAWVGLFLGTAVSALISGARNRVARAALLVRLLVVAFLAGWIEQGVVGAGFGATAAIAFACAATLLTRAFACSDRLSPLRWNATVRLATICAITITGLGGLAGLTVGLAASPPTSPFALVEGALFAAPVGAVVGLLVTSGRTICCRTLNT